MDEAVVAAMRTMGLPDGHPVAVTVACEAVIAWAHARQLEAIHQVSEESPEFFDPTGVLVEPASAEIGCALHWSAGAASRRVDLAATVCTELPGLLAALREGRLDLGKAEEITRGTCELEPVDRSMLARRAVAYAGGRTRAQLRAWLARQVAAIDPDAVARRRKKALRARRVWVQPEPDGMATIGAYLSAEEAQACLNALAAGASNIDGAVDPARADVFVALLTGLTVSQPVPVQVIITGARPEPVGPELAGHGPISPRPGPLGTHPRPALPLPWLPAPSHHVRPRPRQSLAHRRHPRCQPGRALQIPPPAENPHPLDRHHGTRRRTGLDQPPRPHHPHHPRRPMSDNPESPGRRDAPHYVHRDRIPQTWGWEAAATASQLARRRGTTA